jgi:hypothetical protein
MRVAFGMATDTGELLEKGRKPVVLTRLASTSGRNVPGLSDERAEPIRLGTARGDFCRRGREIEAIVSITGNSAPGTAPISKHFL